MSDDATGPAPLSPAVFHVLLALVEGPLHGYGIMKRVEEESGIPMGPGTVYGALQRLVDSGWVDEAAPSADETSGRRGKDFVLTEEGTRALRAEARRVTRLAGLEGVRRFTAEAGA